MLVLGLSPIEKIEAFGRHLRRLGRPKGMRFRGWIEGLGVERWELGGSGDDESLVELASSERRKGEGEGGKSSGG